MAYIGQEEKKAKAPAIKAVLKKYGAKGSIRIRNHSTLVVTISKSPFDIEGHRNVNQYHLSNHYEGECLEFLSELVAACNVGNYDNSDIQTDYFDVGYYVNVQFGRWDKPHEKI